MSLSTVPSPLIKELGTGLHLVTITGVSLVKDNGQPISSEDGGMRLMIRFTEMKPDPKNFEQRFWAKSTFLLKMCEAFKIDATNPAFNKASMSKRGWIAIKEIHHIDGENIIEEDGSPKIEHFIFDFYKWSESLKKPNILGDPAENNGIPSGVFLDYKQIKLMYSEGVSWDMHEKAVKELTEKAFPKSNGETIPDVKIAYVNTDERLRKATDEPEFTTQEQIDQDIKIMEETKDKMHLHLEEPFLSLSQKLKPKTGPIDWTTL